ncbi:hypothetical protein GWK47_016673 [Chionoecetes opilio]|uniref:Uncharacterized protein n=1 Tax=Chionoecetes opilio TaxID=41210 RepID=A0A8J4XRM1_CHIOP|nr:hypothetical protein GWK47_016673 [Chionoecetes opilio]
MAVEDKQLGGDEGVTGSDGTVRDVSLVIKYQTVYGKDIPKPESASCMTSDLHHDLNPSVVPNDTDVVSSTDTTATLIRQRLSITLNKDQDLRLPLLTSPPGKLLWQKEPWQDSAWNGETLINHNELFIPSHQLNGSGIYKIIKESANPVTSSTPGSEKYNVFSLLVQVSPSAENWGCPSGKASGA